MNIEAIVEQVLKITSDTTRPEEGMSSKQNALRFLLRGEVNDMLNLMINIHDTSISLRDKQERLTDLARKCGVVYNQSIERFT